MAANDPFFDDFLNDYFAESEEHLNAANQTLLSLDTSLGQLGEARAVDDLFRFYHSLKAISAMVELRPAEQLAHDLEHYLRAVRERELSLTAAGIEVLIEGTQRLEQIITAHRVRGALPSIEDVRARVATLLPHANDVTAAARIALAAADELATRRWTCIFAPSRELLVRGIGVDAI